MERKGAAYRITSKRDAQDPNNMASGGRRPSGSNIPGKRPSGPGAFGQGPRLEKKYRPSGQQYYEAQSD